jgi:hypothetical protein
MGTNSARLFTPQEKKPLLAKCEVYQTSRASGYDLRVDLPLILKKANCHGNDEHWLVKFKFRFMMTDYDIIITDSILKYICQIYALSSF